MLAATATLAFVLGALAPGDVLDDVRLDGRLSADTLERLRERHGLERPVGARFLAWGSGVLRGDLGTSIAHGVPVTRLLTDRVPNTLLLAIAALALTWGIGLPLGAWAANAPGGPGAKVLALVSGTLAVVPDVSLAVCGVAWAAASGWAPVGGMTSMGATTHAALDVLSHLALPAFVLALAQLPAAARHAESALAEVWSSPLPTALAARGLSPLRILVFHVFRLASGPLVALGAQSLGTALSSALVVESVFGWPGLGPLLLDAVLGRDLPVVVGAVLASSTLLVVATGAGAVVAAQLDPRMRVS